MLRVRHDQPALGQVTPFVAGALTWAFFSTVILAGFGLAKKASHHGIDRLHAELDKAKLEADAEKACWDNPTPECLAKYGPRPGATK